VADSIKFDPSLTSNILRLSNSSFFSLGRTISNINEALVYVGLDQLRKMVAMAGTKQFFNNKQDGYEADRGELWKHCLSVSIISEIINKKVKTSDADMVFVTGLLHDIGKLILSEFVSEEECKIRDLVDTKKISFLDAERELFNTDHAEIGGKILKIWNFSDTMVSAVSKHHTPMTEDDTDLVNIIRLADSLSIMVGYGTSVDGLAYNGYSETCKLYGFNNTIIDSILSEAVEEIKKVESEYEIAGEGRE
jgi:putative nucleotidyltransferase with HDIG domain